MLKNIAQCLWAKATEKIQVPAMETIICEEMVGEKISLVKSADYFVTKESIVFNDNEDAQAMGIGGVDRFIVAAIVNLMINTP